MFLKCKNNSIYGEWIFGKEKMIQAKQNVNKQISERIFASKLMKSVYNFVISLLK